MKIKKIFSAIAAFVMCSALVTSNAFAVNSVNATSNDYETQVNVQCAFDWNNIDIDELMNTSDIECLESNNEMSMYSSDSSWSDSKYVRWKPSGSNSYAYHTLTSRLGETVNVYTTYTWHFASYSNHNGTYSNVDARIVAPGTYFMSAETWSASTGNPNSYLDPCFGLDTPRALTAAEIETLLDNDYAIFVVYNPTTNAIIDFYSPLNPLIAYGWSEISVSGITVT